MTDSTIFNQVVGSLMHLNATSLDMMYVVRWISKFKDKPAKKYLVAAKRILKYLELLRWGCCTREAENKIWWHTPIVIMQGTRMIERVQGTVFMLNSSVVVCSSKKHASHWDTPPQKQISLKLQLLTVCANAYGLSLFLRFWDKTE